MVTIGLHMIVRGEAGRIRECLDSCRGLVDVAVIAVDARSDSDETYAICVELLGEESVYRQVWENDFAKARNDCLNRLVNLYPNIDYIMWMDADDIWTPGENGCATFEEIRARLDSEKPDAVSGLYLYSKSDDFPGLAYYRCRLWRHCPGEPPLRSWFGAVHEVNIESRPHTCVVWPDLVLIHRKSERRFHNTLRNIEILETSRKSQPNDPRTLFYLAREYRDAGDFEKSLEVFDQYLTVSNFLLEKYDALICMSDIFKQLGILDKAMDKARDALFLYPTIAFAPMRIAEIHMLLEEYDKAICWLGYAIQAPHGPVLFDDVPVRTYLPYARLAYCYYKLGNIEKCMFYHRKSKELAPRNAQIRYNDIWFTDNTAVVPETLSFLVNCLDHIESLQLKSNEKGDTSSFIRLLVDTLLPKQTIGLNVCVLLSSNTIDQLKEAFRTIIEGSSLDDFVAEVVFIFNMSDPQVENYIASFVADNKNTHFLRRYRSEFFGNGLGLLYIEKDV